MFHRPSHTLSLSLTHIHTLSLVVRLGDLNLYNECYNESYVDYQDCLGIRLDVCGADDRSVMEAHFISGVCV